MGRKHRHNAKRLKSTEPRSAAGSHAADPSVACITLHPLGHLVAVAVQNVVRVSNLKDTNLQGSNSLQQQQAPVRGIAFDNTGNLFVSAGDDKLVRIWKTSSWELLLTARCPKKVTAAVFSPDSKLVICADKFGDVFAVAINSSFDALAQAEQAVPAQFLLGHLSSIVTSLTVSPDAKYIVSTDQDCKVRVSIMPQNPEKGAHCIQSICMGHEHFAKCAAFVPTATSGAAAALLISGGGDGTLRVGQGTCNNLDQFDCRAWDYMTGKQLDCCTLAEAKTLDAEMGLAEDGAMAPAAALAQGDAAKHDLGDESDTEMDAGDNSVQADAADIEAGDQNGAIVGEEDEDLVAEADERARARHTGQPAVLSVAASPDGHSIAAAIEGQHAIELLHCSSSGQLKHKQQLQLPGVFLPSEVQFDREGQLWVVGGPLSGSHSAICIEAAQPSGVNHEFHHNPSAITAAAREVLEGQSQQSNAQQSEGAATSQVNEQLRKRIYSTEEREARKKNRNDVK